MIKKEELHVLIHSLSKSEKRYFRLFSSREASGKNYLKLFDAIENQREYDEPALRKKFKNEPFVRQLHVTKNYLRNLIYKSLRNFHAGVSKDAALKDILRNIEILYNKELYSHCEAELKRAEALAKKYELLTGMVEAANWKRKLEQALRPHHYNAFKKALAEQQEAIRFLQNSHDHWKLVVEVSEHLFRDDNKRTGNMAAPNDPAEAITLEAKALHYNTAYLLHLQQGNNEQALKELYTLIDLLENQPDQIQEEPGLYVSSINNLVSFLVFNKRYNKALKLIQKAKNMYQVWRIASENRTLLKLILRTYNIELEIYRDMKSYSKHADFIDNIEGFIQSNRYKIPKEYLVSFWFQLASIYFMRQDFSRSLHWINMLLNARFKHIRTDLHIHAHFLNLMVHLEQQNLMVLRYYVDSARRFLKKIKTVQPFENELLKFFIKIGRVPLLNYDQAFAELLKKLFPHNGPSMIPEGALGYIDYREWIEGKLRNKR